MLKNSSDLNLKAIEAENFLKATEIHKKTHTMIRNRPHDKIHVIDRDRRKTETFTSKPERGMIRHGHYVKMSYEELPDQLKEKVINFK